MNLFFQTSRQRSFLSACRIAGKKLSTSVLLLVTALQTVVFYSCRDENLTPPMPHFEQGGTRTEAVSTSGLDVIKDATYGATYKPICRVPLVGEGIVINQLTKSLVSVLDPDNHLEYLIDKDLNTSVKLKGVADINTGLPIFSVRDVNRVYHDASNGIKVGFLYKDPGGILSLDVLKGFWIQTYLKGKKQDGSSTTGSGNSFQLVNLNLLNVSGGLNEISFTTTLPFDEVRIGCASITADVLGGLEFYYAFVGENPKKIATEGNSYPNAEGEETYSIPLVGGLGWQSCNELTNSNLTDGGSLSIVSGLSFKKFRVNFNENIPTESEIGFEATTGNILNADLGSTEMHGLNGEKSEIQTVSLATGIGISLASGNKSSFSFKADKELRGVQIDFPLSVKLGKTTIHYAYSRDPVKIDVSSYFSIGNDTISTDYYDLPTPSEGSVSYSLISYLDGATSSSISGNRITGMTANGDYVVMAIYTREGETSHSYAVIHRNKKEATTGCNVMMINSTEKTQYTVEEPLGAQGGISLFNNIKNTQNLVDANAENYAEATNVLSLIQLGGLVSVKSAQPIDPQGTEGKTRVGFVMQTQNLLLGVDVLKYFFIRLYNGNEEVYSGLTAENNTVGVGLIGNDGSKLRFYVETDKSFDRVELWNAGLLNVSLNTFRLYYAFYEPTTCEEYAGTSEACMEMITAQKHGAVINYAETKSASVADVGATMNNLSYVIDNSQQTAASIVAGVSLISRSTVAVKFKEINGGQPVGAILRTPGYVLNASVLQNITFAAYSKGQAVANESTSSGLASIEVISDAGLAYIEVTPLQNYDEVRISFPSLADALETVWLSGFYIRPDANGNGIPDCAEEPEDQEQNGITVTDITEHVCVNEQTNQGYVRISVEATDDLLNSQITFTCYPYNGNGQKIEQDAVLRRDEKGYFFELSLPVGDYSISGLSSFNGIRTQVHSLKTTWKKNPVDTDWNNWDNWTDGSPWGCTNVVIPTGAVEYPKLENWSYVNRFYGTNCCNNIHFEPGAAVLNTQYLDYSCAYVEMEVESGLYQMISTPLHGMVTGDMFVSPEVPAYFTPLNENTYREVRHDPVVRQKMYSRTVKTVTSTNSGTEVATADWSRAFNAVAEPYEQAQGIKMMVGTRLGSSHRLRFPKEYTVYNYYTLTGGWVKKEEIPAEARSMNGRFTYEDSGFDPQYAGTSFTFELKNETSATESGETFFVAGNPFMSYLDIEKFLNVNKQSIRAIRTVGYEYYAGETTEEAKVVRISLNATGNLVFEGDGEPRTTLTPLQAFYVEVAGDYNKITIEYNSDMFVQPSVSTVSRSSRSVSALAAGEMNISAVTDGSVNSCSLIHNAGASDAYSTKEDVVSLIDEDFMPKVKVYTIAEKRALDIQKIKNATRIDLGFMVKNGSQYTKLTLNYGNYWKGWTLVDQQTGNRYLLEGSPLTVDAGAMKSNNERFYLVKE
mgnify:CR=1 FL=1